MNQNQSLETALATQQVDIIITQFIINLVSAGVLAVLLSLIYIRYGHTLSNRKPFAHTFLLVTMTTMLIISIVKSSLALSLGLVGALSIVRFRAAIKEPEELTYLFFAIAIGLGFGANQRLVTFTAFAVIVAALLLRHKLRKRDTGHNLVFSIRDEGDGFELSSVADLLKEYADAVSLKRIEERDGFHEALFLVDIRDFQKLVDLKAQLKQLNEKAAIAFVDQRGLP